MSIDLSITRSVFCDVRLNALSTAIAFLVDGTSTVNESNHSRDFSDALYDNADLKAAFLIFLGIAREKFLSDLGHRATHHFFLVGDFLSPTLAVPLPFCLWSFLVDHCTSPLFLV